MAELLTERPAASTPTVDLSQFTGIFFEEATENAAGMERMLLELDVDNAGEEELNAIFRCAHSIKGGAATFGFADVAGLTHQMESLLDKLRRRELKPTREMVDLLLESTDALGAQLACHQGMLAQAPETSDLVARISAQASGQGAGAPAAAPASKDRLLNILVTDVQHVDLAQVIGELFRDIPGLGTLTGVEQATPGHWTFKASTSASDDELYDLFSFHVPRERIEIRASGAAAAQPAPAQLAPVAAPVNPTPATAAAEDDFGLFLDAPGSPSAGAAGESAGPAGAAAPALAVTAAAQAEPALAEAVAANQAAAPRAAKAESRPAAPAVEASTLRVAVSKVDQLINLVGELVITQSMLAQHSQGLDPVVHQRMLADLASLERNTRDLQESVMSIRMIPMSVVFSRFPRMLRDLATKLGKEVELVTHGDATELDKGLIEKITDPLTHLVRNSCDHGIELPADRLAAGKPAHGTITLAASHQGGSIVIEVRDDGRGLSRDKILNKARERGLDVNEQMSDAEVWQLIFAPGFSTADEVTEVSGRGVGMDVVKRNITALNGTVEIDSVAGQGMRVAVRLPLTLAIMDGMSVRVGPEVYILPLPCVVESFQVSASKINTLANEANVVTVRDAYMPVVELRQLFNVPGDDIVSQTAPEGVMVVVEAEGSRVALRVDELLGQHQFVVKNLETNYRKVDAISGATIMGDGKVALIIEPTGLTRRGHH